MQKKPLVSVIINCFNGEKYLDNAIKSVLDQDYKNWEIVFFDNNSSDNSYFLLKKYKDKRIKYFKTKKTYPLYKARNLAIKKSKGKLISFLDIDDWWIKSKLSKQVNIFSKNQSIEVIYSNVYLYNEIKKTRKIFIDKKIRCENLTQKLIDKFEVPILSTMIKRKVFNKIKFDNRYTIIGDFDFFIRLSLEKKFLAIQEPLAYYRIHESNLTTKKIDLNIKELKNWIFEKNKNKKFNLINFKKLYDLLIILRIKKNIIKGNRILALKEMLQNPFTVLYFKYIF